MTTSESDVADKDGNDRQLLAMTAVMRSMWLHEQLDPGALVNHLSTAFRNRGSLDADLVEEAIRSVVDRHETLRSTVRVQDGEPFLVLHRTAQVSLDRFSARGWGADRLGEFVRGWSRQPFDLEAGPLCRFALIETGADEQVVLFGAHHLVSDMWSFAMMAGEIGASYVRRRDLGVDDSEPPRFTFAEHVERERRYLRSEQGERDHAFWREELSGLSDAMELPVDRPRRAGIDRLGAVVAKRLGVERSEAVRDLARRLGSSPHNVVLAAYAVVLARTTRRDDVAIATVKSGRSMSTARVHGCFINPSILRFEVDDAESFAATVARLDRTVDRIAPHERFPLQEVIERDDNRRSTDRPFSRVGFLWQKVASRFDRGGAAAAAAAGQSGVPVELGGVNVETAFFGNRVSPYDVALLVTEVDDEYSIAFEFAQALFEASTIHRLAGSLLASLDAAIEDLEVPVRRLALLDPADHTQMLAEWGQCATAVADGVTVVDLIAQAVTDHEDEVAVRFGDRTMTYAELDQRAADLAHRLSRRRVGRDSFVGVHVDRGIDMVVAVVGVLRAGAAFVPLDPDLPAERLRFMVEDVNVSVIVSDRALPMSLTKDSISTISVNGERDDATGVEAREGTGEPAGTDIEPDDLAYAIFTSGSTGRPKAAGIEHRSLVELFATMRRRPGITSDDRVLAQTTLSFDMSIVEILLPLATGATVVVVSRDVALDGHELQRVVEDVGVTIMQATPSVFRALIDDGWKGSASLTLWCGGETMSPQLALRLVARSKRLWNTYGPTETTIKATFMNVTDDWTVDDGPVPLGRAVEGKALFILDRHLEPVPRGAIGELVIGGNGLARGYLGRNELTEERFLPNPFTTDPGARMYRTGDLVRWLPNGLLGFHGRSDDQVKIRGVRVELGEVEAALAGCLGVGTAAAAIRTNPLGDDRLVGYVVAENTADVPAPADIIASVRSVLPDVMVPSVVMCVGELPLTFNGKVDRKRLPVPTIADLPLAGTEAPRSGTEVAVAEVWTAVLGVSSIGRDDNFFHLGGHSLLATKVASRLRRRFDRHVDIRDVFEYPTVAALAVHLQRTGVEDDGSVIDIDAFTNERGVYPVTFSQERMWFLHQLDPSGLAYNISQSFLIRGLIDVDALQSAFEYVVARHDALRTVFESSNGEPFQRVLDKAPVSVEVIDCSDNDSHDQLESVIERMEHDVRRPFDLTALPLTRIALYRLSVDEYVMSFSQHHIIADQWSIGIMTEETLEAYVAFRDGRQPMLPSVEVQLGQYAAWHRHLIEDHHFARHLEYWSAQLADLSVLELPTDRPRPPVQTSRGATICVAIDRVLYSDIERFGHRESVTPFTVTMAAFQLLLYRYSGQSDIAVGTAIANRNWLQSERVIGSLVNTLVVRSQIDASASFRDLVAVVHELSLDAFAHQDMPFDRLVTELGIDRDPSRSPLFQVFFNLQSAPFAAPSLDGAESTIIEFERRSAQFDLSLSISTIGRTAEMEYNTDLFDDGRMSAMFDHYWTLLRSAIDNPDAPIASLEMLSDAEAEAAEEWSAGERVDVDLSVPAHRLIERTVGERPDAVAVRVEGEEVTYRELNERANRLSRYLVAHGGGGAGVVVGVLLDRSIDMLVAVLATMKSGAAYVPMDPGNPTARLQHMVDDTGMSFVMCAHGDHASLAGVERVDPASIDLDLYSAADLDRSVGAEDLAYIIYTSGSTGRPKGVLTEHANLVHYLHGASRRPGMTTSDVVLATTTLSFDPSVHELLLPLVVGARIEIVPRSTAVDGMALQRALETSGATIMQATPTTWRMMIESGWQGTADLTIQCGGEAMTSELVGELCRRGAQVWNQYGPTETTLWATFHRVDDADVEGSARTVQLGRPLANTSLHVVDEHLRVVPAGVPGELCIGGPGVSGGYLARPELTAVAFVHLPGRSDLGRVYRTGDTVIRHRDGRLTFEGRADHQVKVRGHRIELGEIEAALDRHPAVTKSVVDVLEVAPGDDRLVAYVTSPAGSTAPSVGAIRTHLRGDLSDHMIPTIVVPLEAFARTASNKIDRSRLPVPSVTSQRSSEPVERPRAGLETLVARAWSEVLGIEDIGRHDNFFAIGGHSLLAVRVFARLGSDVASDVPLSALFEKPTVAGLAELIAAGPTRSPWTSLVPIRPEGAKTPLFYVSPFLVSVLSLAEIAAHLPSGQPFYGLQPQGMEADDPIHDTVEEMAAHYVAEMRSVRPSGPYLLGGHCAGSWVAFEMARQLQAQGEQVDRLILVDYGPPGGRPSRRRQLRGIPSRLRYYARSGRLIGAIRWPLVVLRERFIGRRSGDARTRRVAELRARHAAAHARYRPTPIAGSAVLVRSSESVELAHRNWHLGWDRLITGSLEVEIVAGTHAGLVGNVHAASLADAIGVAVESPTSS